MLLRVFSLSLLIILVAIYCDEHFKVCPKEDNGEDYECPIGHPETPDFDKR